MGSTIARVAAEPLDWSHARLDAFFKCFLDFKALGIRVFVARRTLGVHVYVLRWVDSWYLCSRCVGWTRAFLFVSGDGHSEHLFVSGDGHVASMFVFGLLAPVFLSCIEWTLGLYPARPQIVLELSFCQPEYQLV